MSDGLGFIRKYGGTRTRVTDDERLYPVCPACNKPMQQPRSGLYRCSLCGETRKDEQLRGLAWVTASGRVIVAAADEAQP